MVGDFSDTVLVENEGEVLYTCGDVNGDGSINLSDVIHLAKYYFGIGDPPAFNWTSDVNCDSYKNLTDVILIANYYFGKIVELNCCP